MVKSKNKDVYRKYKLGTAVSAGWMHKIRVSVISIAVM